MAVTSDDWPRFSLFTGANEVFVQPMTRDIEQTLLKCLGDRFTCECWVQARFSKRSTTELSKTYGSWLVHTPSWACGITTDLHVVVYCQGTWFSSPRASLKPKKWYHFAVVLELTQDSCSLFIDGERIELLGIHMDTATLQLPVSPSIGFCIGWSPLSASPPQLLLHEFRLWKSALPADVLLSWKAKSPSTEHPNARDLTAHWAFSSGSELETEVDLSGREHHLKIIRNQIDSNHWLRMKPGHFRPEVLDTNARLTLWQGSNWNDRKSPFVLQIDVVHGHPEVDRQPQCFEAVLVVLVLNFFTFPSPNLATPGRGAGIVDSLQQFIRRLPPSSAVSIFTAHIEPEIQQRAPIFSASTLTIDNKTQACKIIERLKIKSIAPAQEVPTIMGACILHAVENQSETSSQHPIITAVVIDEADGIPTFSPEEISERQQPSYNTIEAHHVKLTSCATIARHLKQSRTYLSYFSCERDVHWILAEIIDRIGRYLFADVTLEISSNSNRKTWLFEDVEAVRGVLNTQNLVSSHKKKFGSLVYGDSILLHGALESSSPNIGCAVLTARLSYCCPDRRRRVADVTLRHDGDLTNHIHIERAARNARLRVTSDDSLLLEQRRDLMRRKGQFVAALVSAEVADADNSFKKINIMKEELWSKRKWIAQRGFRLTQEDDLKQLAMEATVAEERFKARISALNEQVASKIRETGSRGAHRKSNSRDLPNQIVKLRHEASDSRLDALLDEGDEELESLAQQLQTTVVKLDVQTKAFSEHVVKMEDLFVSVRLAESRGPIIMSDTQRSWIVRLKDMMKTKSDVLRLSRRKAKIEATITLDEEKIATRQEIEDEVKALNVAIARYDKELSKRRKRVILCFKEITESVAEEFSASHSLHQEQLKLSWCSALEFLDIKPEMYPSCIYVCFPIDLSIVDLPVPSLPTSFVSVWCSVSHGLHHCCDAETQTPLCRRLSFGESFLWWGVQQQPISNLRDPKVDDAASTVRQCVQGQSWAVITITYNALFSSARAMADLRSTLAAAVEQSKPVFHIKLEEPFRDLEGFRSAWSRRHTHSTPDRPVEREFLLWKQNLASFHSLLTSLTNAESSGPLGLPLRSCEHLENVHDSDVTPLMPCIQCTWPYVSSTTVLLGSQSSDFSRLVERLGAWIDNLTSSLLQNAPRSYHIDPKAICSMSRDWLVLVQRGVEYAERRYEETRTQRTREIDRQIGKIFTVYENETQDFVAMEFRLDNRQHDVLNRMRGHHADLEAETRLLQTWLRQLEDEDDVCEDNRNRRELESMLAEELHQHLQNTEDTTLLLGSLQERDEIPTHQELEEAKRAVDQALRTSSHAILHLGRTYIENRFRQMHHELKKGELTDQIELATERTHDYLLQIRRLENAFEEGERIRSSMLQQRERFVQEDASDLFYASVLDVRPPSSTSEGVGVLEIQKLSADVEMHITMHASVVAQAMQRQLAYSTALEYHAKLQTAICSFCRRYSPTIATTSERDVGVEDILWLKDYCQLFIDEPSKTWNSLKAMEELVQKEIHQDRALFRLHGKWKLQFFNTLLDFHIRHRWDACKSLLEHQAKILTQVKHAKSTAFQKLKIAESAFRSAVENREHFYYRLALLQRRLVEIKERQGFLLGLLQLSRACYESATVVMNEQLQNVKTDVIYKDWYGVGDYHVALIGELFDLRSQCATQLNQIQEEITACQESLAASEEAVSRQRMLWLQDSIADTIVCTRVEKWQHVVHESLDQILSLEKQRVYQHFRVLDPRGMWITAKTLSSWHETYVLDQQSSTARRLKGRVRRTDVDDSLIQLAIARLDLIKQEKLNASLQRKVTVLKRMQQQQVEMREIISNEVATYQALGERLTARVHFIRHKYEDSSRSQYLEYTTGNQHTSSIDRAKTVASVRASRDQMCKMISAAQHDFLAAEATTCQLSWRAHQYLTSGYRAQRMIDEMTVQLQSVQQYLSVLRQKDRELFDQAMHDASTEDPDDKCGADDGTESMGMQINTGLSVCEYYARDQWFRFCLSETTTLGEKVKALRGVLASLNRGSDRSTRSNLAPMDGNETEAHSDDQVISVVRELQFVELRLLLNRFESRVAERTSEKLKEQLFENASEFDSYESTGEERDSIELISYDTLKKRMFSSSLCVVVNNKMKALLRELATTFDPRDVAGNLSEVVYGASLDRDDLKRIFLLQSRSHVEEQWGIVFVVLFFSRLFRRAALQKAAKRRYEDAVAKTQHKLSEIQAQQDIISGVLRCEDPEYNDDSLHRYPAWAHALLQHVQLHIQGGGSTGELIRIALGVAMKRSLHRILTLTVPSLQATATTLVADELAESRALIESRPPTPTQLEVIALDRHTIKIHWKPAVGNRDHIYVAEISDHQPANALHQPRQSRFWHQFPTSEPTNHTFYSLHSGQAYWIRVRAGFSLTRLGDPCLPLLVRTLP